MFDLRQVGLGDNGGSATVVKSANVLVDLGHEVIIIGTGRNAHTWNKLKAKYLNPSTQRQIPSADAVISTGYKSVASTVKLPDRCGIKCHWIRAWETWQMDEKQIVNKVLKKPTIKLVNSICMRDKLREYGVKSYIVRPGYDFEDLYPLSLRSEKKEVVLGGLYREGVHGRRKRTDWILDASRTLKQDYDIKLWLFGSEKNPANKLIDMYVQKPDAKTKNNFYNGVSIWIAPTESEGLHMPPAEAMITECPVVGTNAKLSGMQDYLIHEKTGLVSDNNINDFISKIGELIENKNKMIELGKNARRRILQIGNRQENMNKLVNLLEKLNV
jgi:glycosyltransferase involved in cell wall biosynthesis